MNDEGRFAFLTLQIGRLSELVDQGRNPMTHFFLRHDATEEQERQVRWLLNDVEQNIKNGNTLVPFEFESRLGIIFGYGRDAQKAHHLAVELVDACSKSSDFSAAIRALKGSGWFSN